MLVKGKEYIPFPLVTATYAAHGTLCVKVEITEI